jgi:hypothetical protein
MSEQLLKTVGTILIEEMPRDAVHFAIVQVVANETLRPGQHVGIIAHPEGSPPYADSQASQANGGLIGVVDPFLRRPVGRGQMCWLFLYPGSITSLRHEWTHPNLDKEHA